ncbi:MAG: hypothetical protein IKJ01_02945 [Lachnospiraceae bacterium]|nr:hypothetical protein [Lachnospiraceae bacterium]
MDIETTIAKNIRIADDKAKYDEACKCLLSEKIILAWIMKSCLEEYKDYDVNEISEKYIEGTPQVSKVAVLPDETNASMIRGLNTEDTTMTEGTITYDIRFLAFVPNSKEKIQLIINVEAQNDFYPGYPLIKRGIYYCSRMISAQYGTEFEGSHYEKIKKVYSIWVCTTPPKKWQNSITRYIITEENMIGNVKQEKINYDLMTVILLCLGESKDKNYNGVLKLLDTLLSTDTNVQEKKQILREDFQIQMTQRLEREVTEMCNLSKGVEEKGRKKGIEQGKKQGVLVSIINLMKNMHLSELEAMNVLGISEIEQEEYREMLKNERG